MVINRMELGARGVSVAKADLEQQGYRVTNLDEIAGHFPLADLIAHRGDERLLVQVRATTTPAGKFAAPADRARKLDGLAHELGVRAVYAFVHLPEGDDVVVRYLDAEGVAVLAERDEADYAGTNKYHVNIDQVPHRRIGRRPTCPGGCARRTTHDGPDSEMDTCAICGDYVCVSCGREPTDGPLTFCGGCSTRENHYRELQEWEQAELGGRA